MLKDSDRFLRRRVQNTIGRRFFRRKYDAAKTLAKFGETARDEVDVERLTARLVAVVEETMQPEMVGLSLRKDPKGFGRFAPSGLPSLVGGRARGEQA